MSGNSECCEHAWLLIDYEDEDGLSRCVNCGTEATPDEIDPNHGLAEEFDYGVYGV